MAKRYAFSRVRGFADWRPQTRILELLATVHRVLEEEAAYLPLTVRQVFYRLVQNHGYNKTENSYANLCNMLNRARRAGRIPWDSLRDDGVTAQHNTGLWSVEGFGNSVLYRAQRFTLDPQIAQACAVEIHVEAAGMMPQIARAACPLGCEVYSSGGFGSVTSQYETAKRIAARDVPTVILSIGDYDPSGISLYFSFKENVREFFSGHDDDWGRGENDWGESALPEPPLIRRIAVTPDQIREHNFITKPSKSTDKRGNWSGGTVQCEAIPPAQLDQLVRDAIHEHYDAAVIDKMAKLSKQMQPLIRNQYVGVSLLAANKIAEERVEEIREEEEVEFIDWRGGHANSDDDDMEEGV